MQKGYKINAILLLLSAMIRDFKTNTVILFLLILFGICNNIHAQEIDLLLKGGRLIDSKNKIDAKLDVAVKDGKIFKVASGIPATEAKKVVDVSGLIVSPA